MNLTEKYKPTRLNEFYGNEKQKLRVLQFLGRFREEKKKALLLWGGTGTGKSVLPYIISNEQDYEIIEFNASDERSKIRIEQTLVNAVKTGSLFGKKRVILIDDVDCLGAKDRGALGTITCAIKQTSHPIILTAEDYHNQKIKQLRGYVINVQLQRPDAEMLQARLSEIAKKESIKVTVEQLREIVKKNRNDVRACLNDLAIIGEGTPLEVIGIRDRKATLNTAVKGLLEQTSLFNAMNSIEEYDGEVGGIVALLEENLPLIIDKEDVERAMHIFSRIDIHRGRIEKTQEWAYYYHIIILTAALCLIEHCALKKVEIPRRIKKLFLTKVKRALMQSIAIKLSGKLHASKKMVVQSYIPLFRYLLKQDARIGREFDLTGEEVKFLVGF